MVEVSGEVQIDGPPVAFPGCYVRFHLTATWTIRGGTYDVVIGARPEWGDLVIAHMERSSGPGSWSGYVTLKMIDEEGTYKIFGHLDIDPYLDYVVPTTIRIVKWPKFRWPWGSSRVP